MSDTYTGAEVYQKLSESLDFMKERVRTLEGRASRLISERSGLESDRERARHDLASAYIKQGDIEEEDFRGHVQELTGFDITYVVEQYNRKEDTINEQILDVEGNDFYFMRSEVTRVPTKDGESTEFEDSRLNTIIAIEEHIAYTGTQQREGLLASGYVNGTHKKGLLWRKHARLTELGKRVADHFDYESFEALERGHAGSNYDLSEKPGRQEMRNSVPILNINPEMTVMEVYTKVQEVIAERDGLYQQLEGLAREQITFATKELAGQIKVIKLANLQDGEYKEVIDYTVVLKDLRTRHAKTITDEQDIREEQRDFELKITELTGTLTTYAGLKNSTKTIPKEKIDRAFSQEGGGLIPVDLPSLAEIDEIVKEHFPKAKSWRNFTQTRRRPKSQREYDDVVRRAGGVGKWTDWS